MNILLPGHGYLGVVPILEWATQLLVFRLRTLVAFEVRPTTMTAHPLQPVVFAKRSAFVGDHIIRWSTGVDLTSGHMAGGGSILDGGSRFVAYCACSSAG